MLSSGPECTWAAMNVTEIAVLDQAVLTGWELFRRSAYENPAL